MKEESARTRGGGGALGVGTRETREKRATGVGGEGGGRRRRLYYRRHLITSYNYSRLEGLTAV